MKQQQETSSLTVNMASTATTERGTNLVQSGLKETRRRISTAPSSSLFFSTITGGDSINNNNKSLGAVLGFVGHPMKQHNQKRGPAVDTASDVSARGFSRLSAVEKLCGPNTLSNRHTTSNSLAPRSLSPTAL
mmetsp:Transcript_42196/g.62057  ORF Transcript_42196/g.62057 Transcript_42196/m.62057 type:complete len:133 (+) Transcript_42196:1220-1618(+)